MAGFIKDIEKKIRIAQRGMEGNTLRKMKKQKTSIMDKATMI